MWAAIHSHINSTDIHTEPQLSLMWPCCAESRPPAYYNPPSRCAFPYCQRPIFSVSSRRSSSVAQCLVVNYHKSVFLLPSSKPLKKQWVDFIFSRNAQVCAKHFTDDCFLNLVQYKAGLAERLKMESGLVPTLLGSDSNLGRVNPLPLYHCVALLCITLLSL